MYRMKRIYSIITILYMIFLFSTPVYALKGVDLWDIETLTQDRDRKVLVVGDYYLYFPSDWDVVEKYRLGPLRYMVYPPDAYDQNGNLKIYFDKDQGHVSPIQDTEEALDSFYDEFVEEFGTTDCITISSQKNVELFDTTCRQVDFTIEIDEHKSNCRMTLYVQGSSYYMFSIIQLEDCTVDYMPAYEYILENAKMSEISARAKEESEYEISPGTYEVGKDIESGEYILYATSSSGYFSVCRDSNEADIIYNSIFEYDSIITINDGEYLKMKHCIAFPLDKNLRDVDTSKSGAYKVGEHIPSGTYNLVVKDKENTGYYCIYSSSRQDNIISNEIFENNSIITVSDGQYLELKRAIFETPPDAPTKTYTDEATIKAVQEKLNESGYNCGIVDGILGNNTKTRIKQYQADHNLEETGTIDDTLIDSLNVSR